MAVAFKAAGALVSTTTTTLVLDQPALDVGDVSVGYFLGTTNGPISGSGYSTVGIVDLSGAFLIAVWKYASVAEAAGSVSVTAPSGSTSGRVVAYSGAGNTAPSVSSRVNASSSWADLPVPAAPGFYVSGGIIWAARAFSSFLNNGSITATSGSAAYDTVSGFRLFHAYSDVTAAGGGNVQVDFSGSNINSNTAMMQLVEAPAGTVYPVSGSIPVVATATGNATRIPANSLSGSVPVAASAIGSTLMRAQVGGATPVNVSVTGAASNPNAPTALYGPTGTNEFNLGNAAQTHQVDATWTAIATQISACTGHAGLCRIEVVPGTLPGGSGFASGSSGVIQNLGSTTKNILVTPRDGYGSVTVGAAGLSFVGLTNIYFDRIDFGSTEGVMVRNSTGVGIGHTKINRLLSTGNGGNGVAGIKFVEAVLGPIMQIDVGYDRSEFKTASGYTMDNVSFVGCYVAPHWKPEGSSAHNDSIQIEAVNGGGALTNFHFDKTILFRSADQGIQSAGTQGGVWRDSAFFGWEVTQIRYPLYPGGDPPTLDNTLNGTWGGIDAERVVVGGSIASGYTFSNSANNRVSTATSRPGWTQDTSLSSITASQLDEMAPYPSDARLAQIWAAAPPATTYPAAGTVALVSTVFGDPYKGTAASGSVPAVTVISGSATKVTSAAGIVPVVSIATANPTKRTAVTGAVPVVSTVTGFAAGAGTLSGAIAVVAGASGTVLSRGVVSGSVPVIAGASGATSTSSSLSGIIPTLTTVSGFAFGSLNAAGQTVPVLSTTSGAITGSYPVSTWYEIRRNLVPNPSIEASVSGWSLAGSATSATRSTDEFLYGSSSLAVTTSGTSSDGAFISVPGTKPGKHTFSLYVKSPVGTSNRIDIREIGVTGDTIGQTFAADGTWRRIWASRTFTTGTSALLILRGSAGAAVTLYIDGALAEAGDLQEYFDGVPALTADGYRKYWAGAANASASIMEALDTRVSAVSTVSGSPIVTGGVGGSVAVVSDANGSPYSQLPVSGQPAIAASSVSGGVTATYGLVASSWFEDFSSGVSPFTSGPTTLDSVVNGELYHAGNTSLASRTRAEITSPALALPRGAIFSASIRLGVGTPRLAGIALVDASNAAASYTVLIDIRNGTSSTASLQIRENSNPTLTTGVATSEPIVSGAYYQLFAWLNPDEIRAEVYGPAGNLIGSTSRVPTTNTSPNGGPFELSYRGVYGYGDNYTDNYRTVSGPLPSGVTSTATGSPSFVSAVAGQASVVSTASGTVGNSDTSGITPVVTTVSGALTSRRSAAGTVPVVSVATANPTKRTRITAVAPVIVGVSGSPRATMVASGTVPVVTTVAGAANPTGSLEGSITVVSTAAGTVVAAYPTGGRTDAITTVSGSLTSALPASGVVPVVTTVSGSILSGIKVGGRVDAISTTAGSATKATAASGVIPVVVGVSGDPTKATSINGSVNAVTDAFGYVAYRGAAIGSVPVMALTSGSTTTATTASGTSIVTTTVDGSVFHRISLFGTTTVIATASGSVINAGLPVIPDILELEGSSTILWLRGRRAEMTLKGR